MLVILFWLFVTLAVLGFVANIVVPVGSETKPLTVGVKFFRTLLVLLHLILLYLVYQTGVI